MIDQVIQFSFPSAAKEEWRKEEEWVRRSDYDEEGGREYVKRSPTFGIHQRLFGQGLKMYFKLFLAKLGKYKFGSKY